MKRYGWEWKRDSHYAFMIVVSRPLVLRPLLLCAWEVCLGEGTRWYGGWLEGLERLQRVRFAGMDAHKGSTRRCLGTSTLGQELNLSRFGSDAEYVATLLASCASKCGRRTSKDPT